MVKDRPNIDRIDSPTEPQVVELPSPSTKRWVAQRKAIVVAAVRNGRLSLQEACQRYDLSVDVSLAWQRSIDRYGVPGLRVTRLQVLSRHGRAARREVRLLAAPRNCALAQDLPGEGRVSVNPAAA